MKTNKEDIRALKSKHRLELVMQETGEVLEVSPANAEQWLSKSTPGLIVDIRRQIYEIKFPGKDESGDVIAWLERRYSWTFGMAVKFLQKRQGDPKGQALQFAVKPKKSKVTASIEDETKPVDHLQEKALQLAGERIREYFSWSYWDLVIFRVREEIRIEPSHVPEITHCQRCDERLDWISASESNFVQVSVAHGHKLQRSGSIPVIAYSIRRPLKISDLGSSGKEFEDAFNQLAVELGALFVEDGVVCVKCAWKEFDFRNALSLCERSARAREQTEEEEQRNQARDAWQETERQTEREQTQMISEWEAARDSAAGGERTELL